MKKLFPRQFYTSLRFRLYVFFSGAVVALSLFIYLYFPQKYYDQRLSSIRKKTITIAEISAISAAMPLSLNDKNEIEKIFEPIGHISDIRFIVIQNDKQELFGGYNIASAITCHYLNATENGVIDDNRSILITKAPIIWKGNYLGSIYVGYSLDAMFLEITESKKTIAFLSGMVFLAGIFLVYVLTLILTKPIEKMVTTFQQAVQNNFTSYTHPSGYSEIDRLGESFNKMVDDLASAQSELHSANRLLELRVHERTQDLQEEIQHHKKTEEALRESEERYRALVELSPDAIVLYSDEKFQFVNSAATSMFKVFAKDKKREGTLYEFMTPDYAKQFEEMINQIISGTVMNVQSEFIFQREDNIEFIADITATRFFYQGRNSVQIVIRDISERFKNERKRLELEQQLLHIQKKEIIGTLASGIAHDILNILGIIGTAINKLLFLKNIDEKSLMESAEQISKASERGKALVKQLLSFAKKTELNFDVTQVNVPVSEIVNVIQRTFPNSIIVDACLGEDLPLIRADNNQLHQALLNLCLNARDAIQEKGKISIETSVANGERLKRATGKNEVYICISVADDGVGMEAAVIGKIFEPFFTTKSEGTGSGLGLAMVKGIVENHRGFIEVESTIGRGSTFRLYFPV